jgi:hypothetical protein
MPYLRTKVFLASGLRLSQPAMGSTAASSVASVSGQTQAPYRGLVFLVHCALRNTIPIQFGPNIEKSQRLRNSIAPATPPLGGLNFFIFFELNGLHGRIGHVI